MTEKAETPKILEELSKSNTAKSRSRVARKNLTARRRILVAVILFLPLLFGLVFLGYQYWLMQTRLDSLTAVTQQLSQEVAPPDSQFSDLSQRLTELEDQVQQQARELRQEMSAAIVSADSSELEILEQNVNRELASLRQSLEQLRSQQANVSLQQNLEPNLSWKILEAEYLLGIAKQKLLLEGDVSSAITLLESADQSLVSSGVGTVFAVRQAITADLGRLRESEEVDREGLYLRLNNLSAQVESIDLRGSMRQNFASRRSNESPALAAELAPEEQLTTDTSGMIDTGLEFLGSIFVWRKWEDSPDAMLAPGQDPYIKQNVRLQLEQAKLALLLHDQTLYQQKLLESLALLQRYAVTESVSGQSMLTELSQLQTLEIDPVLPDINQSLNLINQLVASER